MQCSEGSGDDHFRAEGHEAPDPPLEPSSVRRLARGVRCALMPAVRRELQPLPRQIPYAYALHQGRGLVLDGARLLPAAFEIAELGVAHVEDPRWESRRR